MKTTMTHEEIRSAVAEIYNSFYLCNRQSGTRRTIDDWEKINTEVEALRKKYNSILVEKLLEAFIEEFMNEDMENIRK